MGNCSCCKNSDNLSKLLRKVEVIVKTIKKTNDVTTLIRMKNEFRAVAKDIDSFLAKWRTNG